MRGSKVKMLRRICWTERRNGRDATMRKLKDEFKKGQALGLTITYPRSGRDWKVLIDNAL